MRTVGTAARANPSRHGTLLFDLVADPGQNRPLIDDDLEKAIIDCSSPPSVRPMPRPASTSGSGFR